MRFVPNDGRCRLVQSTLTAPEAARLREILVSAISDLRMVIAHTDAMDFHGLLKQHKAFLMKPLQELPAEAWGYRHALCSGPSLPEGGGDVYNDQNESIT